MIENQTVAIPGSIDTYQLRAQNPHGPFGQPMLSLVSGHFPAGPGQVALTSGVASELGLRVGSVWHEGGIARTVVGIVQNPQSLLDEFALVAPGQVHNPTQVTVLFDGRRLPPSSLRPYITGVGLQTPPNVINPETISVAGLVVGMLLIALVAIGGFTVLAQRRLRSLGMLASMGATDRHVRLVVLANGAVVGVVGAILGAGARPGRLARLPARAGTERAPPDRHVRPAVGGDRPGAAAGRGGRALRGVAARPGHHQGPHRDRPVRPARPAQAGAPLGHPRPGAAGGRVHPVRAVGRRQDSWGRSWPWA